MKVEKKAKQPIEYDTVITLSEEEKVLLKHIVKSGMAAIRQKASTYFPGDNAMCVALMGEITDEDCDPTALLDTFQATFDPKRGGWRDSANVRSILRGLDIYE